MARPAFFVVTHTHGRDCPAIYWEELPHATPQGVVYIMRLDTQPDGEALTAMPLFRLLDMYQRLKRRGKLPPAYDPKKRS